MYVYAAILIAGLLSGFASGWKVQAWRHDSAALAAQEQARETEKMRRQAVTNAARAYEVDKVRIRTEFVPITQEVERVIEKPVYRNVCLDDDGMRVLFGAISRANGVAGKPAGAVSSAAGTD